MMEEDGGGGVVEEDGGGGGAAAAAAAPATAAVPVGSSIAGWAMLYIFSWPEPGWFKMGFAGCPYQRLQRGFWHNTHPPALCGRLNECVLLHAFAGDEAIEKALHDALGADCGEFYMASRLPEVLRLLCLTLERLPLPALPPAPVLPIMLKPCCGGEHGGFQRDDHRRDVHECHRRRRLGARPMVVLTGE